MPAKVRNKAHVAAFAQQLIAGTEQSLQNTATVMILGHAMTPGEIATRLQTIVNLRAEVEAAKASLRAKLAREADEMPALRAFMAACVTSITAAYGSSPEVLATFGITTTTRAPRTVDAKVAAAAKSRATRAARHTMGARRMMT